MSVIQDPNALDEDEYDEEADSDFQEDGANGEDVSEAEDDEEAEDADNTQRRPIPQSAHDLETQQGNIELDLDSGDEATIRERKKGIKKQKRKGGDAEIESGDEHSGWRAKTRSMREREKDEQKYNKLAKIEGATIDVDKAWEEMNRPGPLPPVHVSGSDPVEVIAAPNASAAAEDNKEDTPALTSEETITIKRKFKFAGEVHIEEKVVSKSSAEARLWLSQQDSKTQPSDEVSGAAQRPVRKISRFDPNYHNLDAFKISWNRTGGTVEIFKGPKLNVVEKSKMDWASHVDAEGLKDELDEHAKAKEGYHNRMDFLSQVEQRQEEEARQARTKK